ncbi:sialidase family protein [Cognatishimia sp. F0-27]|uniref:WD40/YVTN/BNR-like repeat-containing protein n=1 Tax=Cognatishimia sp. F0-27 TaxID=2816855 RepID=UPI001D0C71B0|nr:sialidase family protein [Cognatishimia sp. F0-27]MCC1491565.1 exo-alpha-sialidase [Cognatishimia sp. F0-27]
MPSDPGAVTLLVGTTKGLFLVTGGADRTHWHVSGPHCDGWTINHATGDAHTGRIWAVGGNEWHGAGVWRSTDGGASFASQKLADGEMDAWIRNDPDAAALFGVEPQPPAPFTGQVDALWSVARAGDTLYAGAKPATLFESRDDGQTWSEVTGLSNHESRDSWNPGAAGMTLHTIVPDPADPARLWIAISAAGVFATEDGGSTWTRRNRLSNAERCASHPPHPAAPSDGQTGHCVHNMVRTGDGTTLYQQNHHGTYRSRDDGRSWDDITDGLPSTFGFPIAVHPGKPHTIWTLPLNGDSAGRYPPDARAAVWRSRDGGDSWEACRRGLPQEACFFTVLRQSMSVDAHQAAGLYFGTNTGSIFATLDEGDSFMEIARHLPTVLCVEAITA